MSIVGKYLKEAAKRGVRNLKKNRIGAITGASLATVLSAGFTPFGGLILGGVGAQRVLRNGAKKGWRTADPRKDLKEILSAKPKSSGEKKEIINPDAPIKKENPGSSPIPDAEKKIIDLQTQIDDLKKQGKNANTASYEDKLKGLEKNLKTLQEQLSKQGKENGDAQKALWEEFNKKLEVEDKKKEQERRKREENILKKIENIYRILDEQNKKKQEEIPNERVESSQKKEESKGEQNVLENQNENKINKDTLNSKATNSNEEETGSQGNTLGISQVEEQGTTQIPNEKTNSFKQKGAINTTENDERKDVPKNQIEEQGIIKEETMESSTGEDDKTDRTEEPIKDIQEGDKKQGGDKLIQNSKESTSLKRKAINWFKKHFHREKSSEDFEKETDIVLQNLASIYLGYAKILGTLSLNDDELKELNNFNNHIKEMGEKIEKINGYNEWKKLLVEINEKTKPINDLNKKISALTGDLEEEQKETISDLLQNISDSLGNLQKIMNKKNWMQKARIGLKGLVGKKNKPVQSLSRWDKGFSHFFKRSNKESNMQVEEHFNEQDLSDEDFYVEDEIQDGTSLRDILAIKNDSLDAINEICSKYSSKTIMGEKRANDIREIIDRIKKLNNYIIDYASLESIEDQSEDDINKLMPLVNSFIQTFDSLDDTIQSLIWNDVADLQRLKHKLMYFYRSQ